MKQWSCVLFVILWLALESGAGETANKKKSAKSLALPSCFSVQPLAGWREGMRTNFSSPSDCSKIPAYIKMNSYRDSLHSIARTFGLSDRDIRILEKIVETESGWRHYSEKGSVLRGRRNRNVIGLFQICLRSHKDEAGNLGLNLFQPYDNLLYGVYLYKEEGIKPWRTNKKALAFARSVGYKTKKS